MSHEVRRPAGGSLKRRLSTPQKVHVVESQLSTPQKVHVMERTPETPVGKRCREGRIEEAIEKKQLSAAQVSSATQHRRSDKKGPAPVQMSSVAEFEWAVKSQTSPLKASKSTLELHTRCEPSNSKVMEQISRDSTPSEMRARLEAMRLPTSGSREIMRKRLLSAESRGADQTTTKHEARNKVPSALDFFPTKTKALSRSASAPATPC